VGGDFIRGRCCFIDGGKFSSEGAVFFTANLAPGAILFYEGGDIFRGKGRCYFMTPDRHTDNVKENKRIRFLLRFVQV